MIQLIVYYIILRLVVKGYLISLSPLQFRSSL